jgi:hypothetical protein
MKKLLLTIMLVLGMSGAQLFAQGGLRDVYNVASQTITADTLIEVVIPPKEDCRTRLMKLEYTSAGTAHTVTMMRPLSKTTLSAAAGTGQAVVNLTAEPGAGIAAYGTTVAGAIAANDYLVIRKESTGVSYLVKVSSVATLAITLTANVPVAFAAGDTVWFYGVPTNVQTNTARGHVALLPPVSATTTYASTDWGEGIFTTSERDAPVIVSSTNATAAGTIKLINAAYLSYGAP